MTGATVVGPSASTDRGGDPDVVVVGGGHNGLVAAAYLARSGHRVTVVEARPEIGGCAATVSDLGARFNVCNCDHTMVRATPIPEELDLAAHGLHYLEPSPSSVHLSWDDSVAPWAHFHETERTLDALAVTHPSQVEGYRRYLDDALPVARLVTAMATARPTTGGLVRRLAERRAAGAVTLLRWSRSSLLDVMGRYFTDPALILPAVAAGPTVWGVPADQPGTGTAAAGYALRHLVRTGRPRGGSGALPDAVAGSLRAAGGTILCGRPVDRLLVESERVRGVRLADGTTIRASAVVVACDPRRALVEWLDEPPVAARDLVERWRSAPPSSGYESKIDAVVDAPPRYRAAGRLAEVGLDVDDLNGPTLYVSPTIEQLADGHRLRARGRVADDPTILTNVPSALDPAMVTPDGRHVLSVEVLFTPYELEGGWDGSDEPRRWLERWSSLVEPGYLDSIDRWRVMTPDRYEAELGMPRGYAPSYGGSPLATLLGRSRELSRYETPVEGLFLTGAATFPGAGVWGAPGRNAADVVGRHLARA